MSRRWIRGALRAAKIGAIGVLASCAPRVLVELPPAPAVQLHSDTIAVIAADPDCEPFARALLRRLSETSGLRPAPAAALRAVLITCGTQDEPHPSTGAGSARGWALLAVHEGTSPHAWLLGTSHAENAWLTWPSARRKALWGGVAADLAWQLSPSGPIVHRRVFPNAPEGSARALYTQAVRAEVRGDLDAAFRFARAAHAERPSPRAARYLDSIERHRLVRQHHLQPAVPLQPKKGPSPP